MTRSLKSLISLKSVAGDMEHSLLIAIVNQLNSLVGPTQAVVKASILPVTFISVTKVYIDLQRKLVKMKNL